MTRAFEHLRIKSVTTPDLTLCLWDSESSGVAMTPSPCEEECYTDRGDIWGFTSERIKTAFHYSDYSVNVLDHDTATGVYWIKTADKLPYWVDASPLRTLLHRWMERHGLQLMHAAAVGTTDGAVLITGPAGAGKSSTALACLDAGLRYLADDYLVVRHSPEPTAYNLYATAKLAHADLGHYPRLAPLVRAPEGSRDEKAVLFLHPHHADRIVREMPLRAILVPQVADQENTTFSSIEASRAQQAASFTTMSQLPYVGRHTYKFFGRLCAAVPGFRVNLGSRRDTIAPAITKLIADLASPRSTRHSSPKTDASLQYPLVSVVIPVYNGARFLRVAVANILAQSYPSLEIIVVDDGSTDDTPRVVAELPCDVRYFKQGNGGAAAARNRGIRDTTGELIAFLDVDDLWPENSLKMLVDELRCDPALEVVRGHGQLVEDRPEDGHFEFRGNPTEGFLDYIGAAVYRRSVFRTIGLFDPALLFAEDVDWFTRAREQRVRMKRLEVVSLYVRRHGKNMTEGKSLVEMNTLRVFKMARDRRRAQREEATSQATKLARVGQ